MARDPAWHPAYVLHLRPYRETSVLADWFLPEAGRVRGILRGARRGGQWMPTPFQPVFIQYVGEDLKTVVACEPAGPPLSLSGHRLFCGLYLNELLVRLAPTDLPLPELFIAYAGALGALAAETDEESSVLEAILRPFERQLLEAMGQGLSALGLAPDQWYVLTTEAGWQPSRPDQQPGGWGRDIQAVLDDDLTGETRRRLAKLMYRAALAPLLAGRPLRSRELFAARRAAVRPSEESSS